MSTQTDNFQFDLPVPGGSLRTWGDLLNANWIKLDGILKSQTQIIDLIYPVGSVMIRNDAQDPNTLVPGTTWVKTAEGRAVVGEGQSDGADLALGDTFGASEHTLTSAQMPTHFHFSGTLGTNNTGAHTHASGNLGTNNTGAHTHGPGNFSTSNNGSHTHNVKYSTLGTASGSATRVSDLDSNSSNNNDRTRATVSAGAHSHNISGDTGPSGAHSHNIFGDTGSNGAHSHNISGQTGDAGGGAAHNNLPPSQVFAIWERTA